MGFLKRSISLWTGMMLLIVFSFTSSEADVYTDVVGLYKINIKQGRNFVCVPLIPIPEERGILEAVNVSAGTIQDVDASWNTDAYKDYLLLISSGDAEGYKYRISGNTADTLTLTGDLNPDIAAGDGYIIHPIWSLSEMFGDEDGPLSAGTSEDVADNIYKWNSELQGYEQAIWLYNYPGYEGWWQGSTHITNNTVTVMADEACLVEHKPAGEINITIRGAVSVTKRVIPIVPGWNVIGGAYPKDATFQDSGLTEVVNQGISEDVADNIYKWDLQLQGFEQAIWRYNYPGYEHWYQGSEIVDTNTLDATEGFMLKNKGTEEYIWTRVQP